MTTAAPRSRCSDQQPLEHHRVDRVESLERLIDDEQVRVVDDRRHELRLLVHAARQLGALLGHRVAEPDLGQQLARPFLRARHRQPAQRTEVGERFDNRHVAVQAAILGQVAGARADAEPPALLRRR